MDFDARGARGPGIRRRGQPVFQPPGAAIAESLEILGEILHPELFEFGHEGTGWRRAE